MPEVHAVTALQDLKLKSLNSPSEFVGEEQTDEECFEHAFSFLRNHKPFTPPGSQTHGPPSGTRTDLCLAASPEFQEIQALRGYRRGGRLPPEKCATPKLLSEKEEEEKDPPRRTTMWISMTLASVDIESDEFDP